MENKVYDRGKLYNEIGAEPNMIFSFDEQRDLIISYCNSIVIPEKLINPHSIIKDNIQYSKSKNRKSFEINKVFNLNTSVEKTDRAFRVFDTIIKALEHLGYTAIVYAPKSKQYSCYEPKISDNFLYIKLGEDGVSISIKEKQIKVPHVPTEKEIADKLKNSYAVIPANDDVYTGKLTFIMDDISIRKTWNDGECSIIEDEIGDILFSIIDAINSIRLKRETREAEEKRRLDEKKRKELLQKKREFEIKKMNQLISLSEDYFKAQQIYNYIASIEQKILNSNDSEANAKRQKYISWARKKADWLNPLIASDDELFGKKHELVVDDVDDFNFESDILPGTPDVLKINNK